VLRSNQTGNGESEAEVSARSGGPNKATDVVATHSERRAAGRYGSPSLVIASRRLRVTTNKPGFASYLRSDAATPVRAPKQTRSCGGVAFVFLSSLGVVL